MRKRPYDPGSKDIRLDDGTGQAHCGVRLKMIASLDRIGVNLTLEARLRSLLHCQSAGSLQSSYYQKALGLAFK